MNRHDDLAGGCVLLSRLLLHPLDAPLSAQLRDALPQGWPLASLLTDEPARDLAEALPADESSLVQVRRDYQRLLVGPGHLLATPYESVYTSPEHLVFDASTSQVRAVYAELGLQAPRAGAEPDDHLGLELHFLAICLDSSSAAIAEGRAEEGVELLETARRFAHEHILVFGDRVAEAMVAHAETAVYRAVGDLLSQALDAMRLILR